MQLVLASNNAKKIAEIKSLLPEIKLVSLQDIGFTDEIPEPYNTFRQNAAHKAETIHQFCKFPVLADDSGLCVAALDGAPGVYSARYAGTPTDDARNSQKLLAELNGIQNRDAFFICTIALAGYQNETLFFEGTMAGTIAKEASGTGGFGYDPVFIPEGQTQTLADLPPTYKSAHSHRAKALAALLELLG
jgi:XTP/dITP diphosphohydrolase